jgi:hypothetical protein
LYFALVLLYYFALEAALGQTVGKLLLGLRVVRADGGRPSVVAVAVRTLLRVVDWLPLLYLIGFITMMATGRRRRRLGDLAARTSLARAPARHRSLALAPFALLLLAIVGLSVYRAAGGGDGEKQVRAGTTFHGDGFSFTYPAEWSERTAGPVEAGGVPDVTVGPEGHPRDSISVQVTEVGVTIEGKDLSITEENIDENAGLLSIGAEFVVTAAGGKLGKQERVTVAGCLDSAGKPRA